ncbi:membrane protein DedA with SNARE-associated domain [Salinibacterium sp. CAN_S4]|uniref:DedA family protein n=1 Tax=Salinibacterium sp. CAN_S4 TaxID=2787727 RepID=UPI001A26E39F
MDGIAPWIQLAAEGPWLYVGVMLLVIADAFAVVLPSETVVVALGSLAFSTGAPNILLLLAVAALGAVIGDNLCYLIGRSVGTDRFRWMRRPRIHAAFDYARRALTRRPASLILTARYVPFARIAVNLTAGATGFPYRSYLPLTLVAGASWALYNCFIGALFGAWLAAYPVVAVIVSVLVAISLGVAIDGIMGRLSRRKIVDSSAG